MKPALIVITQVNVIVGGCLNYILVACILLKGAPRLVVSPHVPKHLVIFWWLLVALADSVHATTITI